MLLGTADTAGRAPGHLSVLGTWAFTTSRGGEWIGAYDLTDPMDPQVIGGRLVDSDPIIDPAPIHVFGANAYISTMAGITRLDITACLQ